MKKFVGLLLAVCTVGACTTPEEDAQIRLFWTEQVMQLMFERAMSGSFPAGNPAFSPDKKTSQELEESSQELEKILQEMQKKTPSQTEHSPLAQGTSQGSPAPAEASAPKPQQAPAKAPAVAKVPRTVEAMLFVSPTCPRCQRLRREGWVAKFEDKYAGKVALTEYDLSSPKNEKLLQTMMRKYNLRQVGYPTLFIGGYVVQGYPLNADPVVEKVLAKHGWTADAATQKTFLEITLEDTRVNKLKSNAPLKDRQAMQRAIERVKQSNQQALQDIGSIPLMLLSQTPANQG